MLLQLLREYIFAVGENDNVLLASRNENIPLVVYIAYISGTEPTVIGECFTRSLGILKISHHNVVARNAYLARFIRLILLLYTHAASLHGLTDRMKFDLSGRIYRHERSALRDPVALQHGYAEGVKILDDLRRKRSTAANYALEIAAEGSGNVRKELVAHVNPEEEQKAAELHSEPKLFLHFALFDLIEDLLVHSLHDHGDEHQGIRLIPRKILHNMLKAVVYEYLRTQHLYRHLAAGNLVRMMRREDRNEGIVHIVGH